MFVASKISEESLPLVDQNKKQQKYPKCYLKFLCPFSALRWHAFLNALRKAYIKTICNLASIILQSKEKRIKKFLFPQ